MLFAIINGQPYLVTEGRAVPCKISGGDLTIDSKGGFMTDEIAHYTLNEIVAKLGDGCSSIKTPAPRKKKVAEKEDEE